MLVETVAAVQVSVVAAVMPAVSRDLHGIALYGLVFSGYTLAGLAATPLAGYLADRYGPGRPFAITTGVFVLGSLLCGLAPSMSFLAAARVIQGWGAAALYTIAYGAIAKAYPESGRARMLALLSGAWVVPGLVGPGFGAIVTQTIGWRWCFFGLLPIVAIAYQMAYRDLARLSGRTASDAPPWQWPVILAVGAGLLVTGLADSSPVGIVFDVVGLILFVPAVRRVLPRGTFRLERGLPSAVLSSLLLFLAFFVGFYFLPLLITQHNHRSLLEAGLAVTAVNLTWTIGNWWQASAVERYSKRLLVGASSTVLAVSFLAACLALIGMPLPVAYIAWAIGGAAMGIGYPTLYLIAVESASAGSETVAVAALMTTNRLGTSVGTGLAGAFIAISSATSHSIDAGLGLTFGLAAAGSMVAAALTRRL
ncbi:MAG TPA: MFS transporter [Candidatus Dormibacteraeota bacterium]|nr:MFS transporter [Candidatus Dormibacteraeota bacterium]